MTARLDEPRLVGIDIPLNPEDQKRLRDRLRFQYETVESTLGGLPEKWNNTLCL